MNSWNIIKNLNIDELARNIRGIPAGPKHLKEELFDLPPDKTVILFVPSWLIL